MTTLRLSPMQDQSCEVGQPGRPRPSRNDPGGERSHQYYKDPHELVGKCDFVMANPPFNVDEVDAEKVMNDKRLPFGLGSSAIISNEGSYLHNQRIGLIEDLDETKLNKGYGLNRFQI